MRIGIIGAGNIGGALVHRLTALGHDVRVANSREPGTLADLARETGASAVWAKEAPVGADLVVVTVPLRQVPALGPLDVPDGTPVIDTNNYYPRERDGLIAEIEAGQTESEWVAQQLGTPVVKAFNGIYAQHLLEKGVPAGDPGRIALPVAGADGPAKQAVLALVDELGFDAVDAGTLADSWRQQPGSPVYGADADADATRRLLAEAPAERPDAFRADA